MNYKCPYCDCTEIMGTEAGFENRYLIAICKGCGAEYNADYPIALPNPVIHTTVKGRLEKIHNPHYTPIGME